jgi:hypothetical protein
MSKVHLALSRYKTSPELRDAIERQAGELVSSELNRCDDEWHAAVASVKDTVAVLERTCDAFLNKTHLTPSGAIAHLVDRMVKTASDEAERAAERVRAEAVAQLASAETVAKRLETELNSARGELITTRERFDTYTLSLMRHGQDSTEHDIAWLDGLIKSERRGAPAATTRGKRRRTTLRKERSA